MKTIEIVEVPSELGAGTRGASLGIEAIKISARNSKSSFFSKFNKTKIKSLNDALDMPPINPNGKYIEGILDVGKELCDVISTKLTDNVFPLVLSGDHSMAYATIAGIKKAFPDKRLGIIWIDAHADLHSPYTSPSGNMHGMPLAIAAAEDNLDCHLNQPIPDTIAKWERIKNMGINGAKYDYQDLVFIGVRSTERPERYLMDKNNLLNITVEELRLNGLDDAIKKTKARLENCDIVYVSFDVDSLDPTISKGTGTPVPGGLSREEATYLNCNFVNWDKTIAWELVEVNPILDKTNKMADAAFGIILAATDSLEKRFK